MNVTPLGCSGGLANRAETTAFLVDDFLLLDGGTGAATLSKSELDRVEYLLLTHAHLDHVAGIALLIASFDESRVAPLKIVAPKTVLEALKTHIFNWQVWPDFSQIPSVDAPFIEYLEIESHLEFEGLKVEAIPLTHTVPSFAYRIESDSNSICFCGDTGPTHELWQRLNSKPVDHLFIELSYTDAEHALASVSGHHTVSTLIADLNKLQHPCSVRLMHMKPGQEDEIKQEFEQRRAKLSHTASFCEVGQVVKV
jgi:ribonuclease BN (tRNA processing enzyme)